MHRQGFPAAVLRTGCVLIRIVMIAGSEWFLRFLARLGYLVRLKTVRQTHELRAASGNTARPPDERMT